MSHTHRTAALTPRAPAWSERLLRNRLLHRLQGLRDCTLIVRDGSDRWTLGDGSKSLSATVEVHDPAFYRHAALGGSTGAGESFIHGHWSCDDLTALVRILVRNRDILDSMETGSARIGALLLRLFHFANRNTRHGSRRNIAAHYDLGNELFELFLDQSMMYSCAVYRSPEDTLEQAQFEKLERICRKLQLGPDDQVMEIGTGWGGFAIHAAGRYGCRVTTATISREQRDLALRRIEAAGLSDRIEVRLQDYRELEGRYDKLVSIEMIEAVGHHYLDSYLRRIGELLKPEGMALIQAITIEDHRYARALKDIDYIKRFIFPGSFIPSVSAIAAALAGNTRLRLFHLEDIGPSYALTLREWRRRFLNNLDEVRRLGYPEAFIRMWMFYLCYCEGGFEERSIGDVQMLLTGPACRRPSITPALGNRR